MDIKMNEGAGQELYQLCKPFTNFWEHGMDWADFIETLGISTIDLDTYFAGEKDLPQEHLRRIAWTCLTTPERLTDRLNAAYNKWIQEQEEARLKEIERQNKQAEQDKMDALERKILAELAPYDITKVYKNSKYYPLEEYYPLKFIMNYLENPDKLKLVKERLEAMTDEELVHKDSNALMWAADSLLSYQLILLLTERKEFIAQHIRDQRKDGQTVLHLYANHRSSKPEGIELLVGWGADVNAKDEQLWTPLHDAQACQNDAMVAALYKAGAVSSQNIDGNTPGDIRFRMDAFDAW